MAEALAEDYFEKKSPGGYEFFSRGVSADSSSRASKNAAAVMEDIYEIDISGHMSRQVTGEDVSAADLILTMTEAQKSRLAGAYPQARDKIHTLREFTGGAGDISDPFGRSYGEYKKCAKMILHCVKKIKPRSEQA